MVKALRMPLAARGLRVALVLLAQALAAAGVGAQVYVGTDSSGSLLLSNFQSDRAAVLLVASEAAPPPAVAVALPVGATRSAVPSSRRQAPAAMQSLIEDVARHHEISVDLLTAVISVESGFDARAVSPKGAKGLMQLMPATASRFGVKDVFAPRENLHGGAAYLRLLMHMFDNDIPLALAAYNAGEGAVVRAGRRIPPYAETQQYVAMVMARAGEAVSRSLNSR